MGLSASTRNLSLWHTSVISPGQGCCCSPSCSAVGVGPEPAAGSFAISLCTYLLSSCQLWSTSSACSTCTGSSCLCLSRTVGWTWEEMGNKIWNNQPGTCTLLAPNSPKYSPRPHWAMHCLNPEKNQRFARKGLNQRQLGPVPPLPRCRSCQLGAQQFQTTHPARTVMVLAVKAWLWLKLCWCLVV